MKKSKHEAVQKCPHARHPTFACLVARTGKDSFVLLRYKACLSADHVCTPRTEGGVVLMGMLQ